MKLYKTLLCLFVALAATTIAAAQAKPASPAAVEKGKINDATIEIKYSSPFVKGRKIWGELVPFNKVWRAGANAATTFATDKDLVVEGSKLPAGKYAFFVIPNEKESIVIFNKVAEQSGAYNYDEKQDQLRVTVKNVVSANNEESLVYRIKDNKVVLSWEKWSIPISVK
jgi:hypothetical protein